MPQYIVTGRNQGYPRPPYVDLIPDEPQTVFTETFDPDVEAALIDGGFVAKYPLPEPVLTTPDAADDTVPTSLGDGTYDWEAGGGGGSVPDSRWGGHTGAVSAVPGTAPDPWTLFSPWTMDNSAGSDITVTSDGHFTFATEGVYLVMASAECTPANGATHLAVDWRDNDGIIAGIIAFDVQPQQLVQKDNTVYGGVNVCFWLRMAAAGWFALGVQTVGASDNEDVYAAIDIVRLS